MTKIFIKVCYECGQKSIIRLPTNKDNRIIYYGYYCEQCKADTKHNIESTILHPEMNVTGKELL